MLPHKNCLYTTLSPRITIKGWTFRGPNVDEIRGEGFDVLYLVSCCLGEEARLPAICKGECVVFNEVQGPFMEEEKVGNIEHKKARLFRAGQIEEPVALIFVQEGV